MDMEYLSRIRHRRAERSKSMGRCSSGVIFKPHMLPILKVPNKSASPFSIFSTLSFCSPLISHSLLRLSYIYPYRSLDRNGSGSFSQRRHDTVIIFINAHQTKCIACLYGATRLEWYASEYDGTNRSKLNKY